MAAPRGPKQETLERAEHFARIIAAGGRRSDCIRYARENWGVKDDACDLYLRHAREKLKADWDIERPQMVADLLSQCATLQQEARQAGQYHIALGAINTAAKLAQLCS
jgi:hypothetical protein